MGEVLAGRYELVDLIDSGGSGAVWRIWDHQQGVLRAGKILRQSDADSLLRFVRETSRRIEHSHIAAPDGWYGEDGRVMLTMPLVAGGSLASLLRGAGRLPLGWSIEVLRQVLLALAAVHEVGLVHRDLKPANLLLDATGRGRPHLRLADFGTAAHVGAPRLTQTGFVIGTQGYMAPEYRRGADPDPRQDLFAAGVVATVCVTGQTPEPDGTPLRLDDAALRGPTAGPFAELLADLMHPDPAHRPASAAQALARLDAIPGARDLSLGTDPQHPIEVVDHLGPLPPDFRVPPGWHPPAVAAGAPATPGPQLGPALPHWQQPADPAWADTGTHRASRRATGPRRRVPVLALGLFAVGLLLLAAAGSVLFG